MSFSNRFVSYMLVLAAVAVAFILRIILVHFVGSGLPTYITFYPFIMFVAIFGGLGPGLLASIISALIVDYWFLAPQGFFEINSAADAVGLIFFLGMGILMSGVAEHYRRSQKKYTEAMRLANNYNRSLLEASLDPLVTISKEGKITDVNEATIRATGISREKLRGTDFFSYFTEPEKARQGYKQVFEKGFVSDYPLTIRHKDGKLIDVLYNATVYRNDKGDILGVFAAARDVTLLKQAEQELKRHRDSLEILVKERTIDLEESNLDLARSNENLEQFAYVASHDLQEPLRVMSSYSQLLEKRYKDKLDQDAKDFINFIVDAANRMQKLINDLLTYSRISRKESLLKEVDFDEVVNKVIDNMSSTIGMLGGKVTHDKLPVLMAHETSIIQIFQNLIANALKFHSEKIPSVHVSVKKNKDEWVFSVTDNGLGIEPQYHEQIFQIFQRLHSREEYPGTGIGLSICKKIVTNYGGKIWVESEAGEGLDFLFYNPDIKENVMANGNCVSPIEILLVEDSPADVRLTKEALKEEKLHMNLSVVGDGVEAMQFLHREGKYSKAVRPDLILLDLNLPKKDGREVLKELKSDENLRTIPTVILTVSKAEEDVLKTYNLHANCYITKPLDLEQFSHVVKSIKEFWLTIVKLPPNGSK